MESKRDEAAPRRIIEADVIILGAGPAGAIAALNLAPTHRVVMLDRRRAPPLRIGESLSAAARRLLSAMGLWESFMRERHAPSHGDRTQWGSEAIADAEFRRDPSGPGWHVDRARFETWLREAARSRGASLLCPVAPRAVERRRDHWHLALEGTAPLELRARALIDASGRSSWLARHLGARRVVDDHLVCGWTRIASPGGVSAAPPQLTHLVAEPDGWWYSAPLPGAMRMLAFHTDADLEAARDAADRSALLARARRSPLLAELLGLGAHVAKQQAQAREAHALVPAHGGALAPAGGDGWLAAGDAALSFDPLASQGLLHSMFTGLAAAEATARALAGDAKALADYANVLAGVRGAYLQQTSRCYREEQRFGDRPFWRRRHQHAARSGAELGAVAG